MTERPAPAPAEVCRILALDGGGAKGFYTLGVLNDIEAMIGNRLHGAGRGVLA
jgi:patatin-like phospholipase/acyl hydrolase